jgi:YidC/Oxa1 family membrane protein insertase
MREFFYTVLYEPLFNLLIWLYDVMPGHDLGIAIIILTLIIKLLLFYPSLKTIRSQKALQDAQPHIEALRKQYADDKEELGRQIMKFYKENKVNPLSSCLPLLIQLPILWALFKVFFDGLETDPATGILAADQLQHLYQPLRDAYMNTPIDSTFLGFVDLSATKNIVLAVLAGLMQFLQAKMLTAKRATVTTAGSKDENMAANINKQMTYFLPIITVIFGYQFPAGVTLYWLSSTAFTWVQQLIFLRERKKLNDAGSVIGATATVDSTAREVTPEMQPAAAAETPAKKSDEKPSGK